MVVQDLSWDGCEIPSVNRDVALVGSRLCQIGLLTELRCCWQGPVVDG